MKTLGEIEPPIMMLTRRVLWLWLLLVAPLAALGEPPPYTRLPLTTPPPASTEWFGVYLKGAKAGYFSVALHAAGADGSRRYQTRMRLSLVQGERTVRSREVETWTFDGAPGYALRSRESTSFQDGEQTDGVLIARRTDGRYQAILRDRGQTRRRELGRLDITLADVLTAERWLARPRAVGDRIRVRTIDDETLAVGAEHYRVTGARALRRGRLRVPVLDVQVKSPEGTMTAVFDARGRGLRMTVGALVELRAEPEASARRPDQAVDLFASGTTRIDRPLGDPQTIAALELTLTGPGAAHVPAAPGQAVERDASTGAVRVTLGPGLGTREAVTAEARKAALAATVSYPARHPDIVALARKATGDATTPAARVAALVRFVDTFVIDDENVEPASVFELIRDRKGDCTAHAALFTTLARAAGIPSREISGLAYMGDEHRSLGGHAWNEVELDGHWVPVDPTFGQLIPDAGHLTLGRGPDQAVAALHAMGGLTVRVTSIRRKPRAPR